MPHSQKQVRYAHAVASGKGKKKDGMPPAVATEILGQMKGRKMSSLPERSHSGPPGPHGAKISYRHSMSEAKVYPLRPPIKKYKKKLFHSKKGY